MNKKKIAVLVCLFFVFFAGHNVLAETVTILGTPINVDSIDGFISLGIAIAEVILGITGSLALLMFVWGGTLLLFYGYDPKNVQKGKDAIKNAIIGLVIIFTSYMIVQFVIKSLGGELDNNYAAEGQKEGLEIKAK